MKRQPARCGALLAGLLLPAMVTAGPPANPADAHWPSFRGPGASGVADGQRLPLDWDVPTAQHLRWKTRIPGLAHSSPITWGDRVFVTTAVSSEPKDETIRHGLYGDGAASPDHSVHRWMVYCLDIRSGRILWQRTAHQGVPRSKRHIKATYANCTPATDGRVIVAHFGSEGLHAFEPDGTPRWRLDLGDLDVGAYDAPDYEWGPASSPILYRDRVIVQCDTQGESFILCCDARTGKTLWKTPRDELPSWGTPTIWPGDDRVDVVANGSNFIRGYDPEHGRERWRLGGSSKITAPTPILADDLLIVCSGRGPEKPIFAIRGHPTGNISLTGGATSSRWVAWSKTRRGPYMPTPIAYRGLLYTCANDGVLTCYNVRTGFEHYRTRIEHGGGGFSGSPVAADGRIYLPGEDGEVFVIQAGPQFELLARNSVGEVLMATPALSHGSLIIRGRHHVVAIGTTPGSAPTTP